jgi:4-hydroxy-3-methylbut-2-enyl diphosphate reductase
LRRVGGRRNSANTTRLREPGRQIGVSVLLVQYAAEINPDWLHEDVTLGLPAGASTPDASVLEVSARLAELGWTRVQELPGASEPVTFRLPAELLRKLQQRRIRAGRQGSTAESTIARLHDRV